MQFVISTGLDGLSSDASKGQLPLQMIRYEKNLPVLLPRWPTLAHVGVLTVSPGVETVISSVQIVTEHWIVPMKYVYGRFKYSHIQHFTWT